MLVIKKYPTGSSTHINGVDSIQYIHNIHVSIV